MDLDETARDLVAAGYERVDQVEDAVSSRSAAACWTCSRRPRTARSGSTCSATRSSRCGRSRTFTQRSLGDAEMVEVAPAAELAEEHRELAEIAALESEEDRPDIAELLPVEDFQSFLELIDAGATVLIAGEEDVAPALADHWQDVTAAFHDEEAHHLYVAPEEIGPALDSAGPDPAVEHRPGPAVAVPRPGRRDRRARDQEAEPELEKLARSGYRTVVAFARRGEGERPAYNLGRLKVRGWTMPATVRPPRRSR